jgi:outer membrane protein OmpA-like peptidoglycan-associated protein
MTTRLNIFFGLAFILLSLLVPWDAAAQIGPLILANTPAVIPHLSLEAGFLVGVESGVIPAVLISPQIDFGLFGRVQLYANLSLGVFYREPEFRMSEYQFGGRVRLFSAAFDRIRMYTYLGMHHTIGDPISAVYEGDEPRVHTVISEHTDSGIDMFAGVSGKFILPVLDEALSIQSSVDYARTFLRKYNPSFDSEGYKNRIGINATPTLEFEIGTGTPGEISIAIQNRFLIWFSRGFIYDILPQVSYRFHPSWQITLGGALPAVGGRIFKLFLAGSYSLDMNRFREVRITVRDINFPPDHAILYGEANEKSSRNRRTIRRLYRKLERYPEYTIRIEGHTSFVYWNDPVKGPIEQRDVLLPLSQARAEAVMHALAEMGIPYARMTAVGKGGTEPAVPFADKDEQWKNRRVEIVLTKS